MTPVPNLSDLDLPDVVRQFANERSGLIVFAGDSSRPAAYALAEHTAAATGRTVTALTTRPVPPDSTAQRRDGTISEAISDESQQKAPVLLIETRLTADSLADMVAAASQGALVITEMASGHQNPYLHLVDLIQASEDWDGALRRDFDAALYAIISPTAIHQGNRTLPRSPNAKETL